MNQDKATRPTMKEVPLSERPYELMEERGAENLTDAQLLAVFLQSGTKGENVLELATRLMSMAGTGGQDPLSELVRLPLPVLTSFCGVGRVKALQIRALGEMSARLSSRQARERLCVSDPASVAGLYMEAMRHLDREIVRALYLNTRNAIVAEKIISQGSINRSVLSPREVFAPAMEKGSSRVILLHNHPSGDPSPSQNDILLTKKIAGCGELLEIELFDHVILGDGTFCSMKEAGII